MSTESERNSILRQQVAELEAKLGYLEIPLFLRSPEGVKSDVKREFDKLLANNARLRDMLMQRDGGSHDIDCKKHRGMPCNCMHDDVLNLLSETPDQSLNEIKAAAIEKMLDDVMIDNMDQLHVMEYANNLRGRQ